MCKLESETPPTYATVPTKTKLEALIEQNSIPNIDVIKLARKLLSAKLILTDSFDNPQDTATFFQAHLHECEEEHFAAMFLNVRHRLIHFEILFHGTIDGATVYPRVICKRALQHNAAAIIVAHNHPSGNVEPSWADRSLTKRITEACKLIEVVLLDHFVIGTGECTSFAQRGWM